MVSLHEDDDHAIEDKRNGIAQKVDTHWNWKRHMTPVSLSLRHEMTVMHCFIWPLALQLWSGRLVDQNSGFGDVIKFNNTDTYKFTLL